MLTRLRVQNFKNLRDVEVHFGPLTVIAGPNGVGKSNLLDAIRFLGFTADRPLAQAARDLRGAGAFNFDARKLFFASGDKAIGTIKFDADIVLPSSSVDFLGQQATPSWRFVRYELELEHSSDPLTNSPIQIVRESLLKIPSRLLPEPLTQFAVNLVPDAFILPSLVETEQPGKWIKFFHEGISQWSQVVANMPDKVSTLVSRVNAAPSPTISALQQELKSWAAFHLSPDRLATANSLSDLASLTPSGENLPAALFRLAKAAKPGITGGKSDSSNPVYARIVSQLRNLVPNLEKIWVNLDAASSTLYLLLEDSSGNVFHSTSLSDGTLRLIAIAAIMEDHSSSLIAFEEPENGFHPRNLIHLQHLLQDIVDLDPDSPRQLVLTTHSPGLVALTPEDALLFATSSPRAYSDPSADSLRISCLSDTWRAAQPSAHIASLGDLVSFMGIYPDSEWSDESIPRKPLSVYERREFVDYRLQAAL